MCVYIYGASLPTQMVKNLPDMQKTQVRSLAWEDPLEKRMATHSSNLAWRTPWTEEPGGPQLIDTHTHTHVGFFGENKVFIQVESQTDT